MSKPKPIYILKGADGTYYVQGRKVWKSTSRALAAGMRVLVEKEKGQTYEIRFGANNSCT